MSKLRVLLVCMCVLDLMQHTLMAADDSNILLYKGGTVEVNAQINAFETIQPNKPISGNIMVTHDVTDPVDATSFRMGDKPLLVQFVQTVPMSSTSKLVLSIYSFKLEGREAGVYTLPPITVKVGSKEYQAPPLTLQVGS